MNFRVLGRVPGGFLHPRIALSLGITRGPDLYLG